MKARPGRPRGSGWHEQTQRQITLHIDNDLAELLRGEMCMSATVNYALRAHYRRLHRLGDENGVLQGDKNENPVLEPKV